MRQKGFYVKIIKLIMAISRLIYTPFHRVSCRDVPDEAGVRLRDGVGVWAWSRSAAEPTVGGVGEMWACAD